jgi:multiple sugar transport system ATP-binding protein
MAAITYKNASCIYEGSDKLAVDNLNLDIQDGEFIVLVGPSGSGKSTALRMLAGLEDIDEGSIEIGGKDMTGVPSKDRDIAMVFQNYALYPNKTVAENMGFALKLRGVPAAERRKKVEEAAKVLDLSSSWMSRCRTSTPSCACRLAPRSPRCNAGSAPRPSTSPTTRSRR